MQRIEERRVKTGQYKSVALFAPMSNAGDFKENSCRGRRRTYDLLVAGSSLSRYLDHDATIRKGYRPFERGCLVVNPFLDSDGGEIDLLVLYGCN